MANIKYSELLDEVLPNLAADPSDPVTENAIKRAVIEFCAGARVWQYLPDALDVTAGELTVDLEPEQGADVGVVMHVALNGAPLENKSIDWLDRNEPGWRSTAGTPNYFTQVDTEQIILAPLPAASARKALVMTMALQPSHTATSFPAWIFSRYAYALADGAMSKLMLMPGKPWTDIPGGADRRTRFEQAISNARANAVGGLSRAATRTTSQH